MASQLDRDIARIDRQLQRARDEDRVKDATHLAAKLRRLRTEKRLKAAR